MMQLIGTTVCFAGIAWLFYLDRDPEERPLPSLWIPTVWLLINGSRSLSTWLHMDPSISLAQQYTESSPLDAVFYGFLIAAGVLVLNYRSQQVKGFLRQNVPLLLFISFCLLSVLWSDYPLIAFKRWCKSVGDLVMVMIVLTDPQPKTAIRHLFKRAAFVLLPLSVLFIQCYPDLGSAYSPEDMTLTYFGVTTFKNLLGMISMVCGLLSLWAFLRAYEYRWIRSRARHMIAHGVVVGTAIWLIVTADSMTSLSCLVLAGSVMVLVRQRWITRWRGGVHVIMATALAVPLFALFAGSFGTLIHSLGRNATLTGRTAIWKAVLSIHTSPLLGAGFESFWLGDRLERVWNMSVQGIQEAHNGYIELYLNLGWLGLFLLSVLIVTGYYRAIVALRRDQDEGALRLALLTAALIFSMTEAGFRMLSPIWFAFLLAIAQPPAILLYREGKRIPGLFWLRASPLKQIRILQ